MLGGLGYVMLWGFEGPQVRYAFLGSGVCRSLQLQRLGTLLRGLGVLGLGFRVWD